MIYLVLFHDYENKSIKVIKKYTSKYAAIQKIEQLAKSYIYDKMGSSLIKIFNKNDRNRPNGYYIYRNASKHTETLKIKHKKVYGYIYNSAEVKTICCFSVCEYFDDKPKMIESATVIRTMMYDQVINSLEMNRKFMELSKTYNKNLDI